MFYWTSKSAILVEKGVFFSPRIRKKEVFYFSNLGTSVVYVLVGGAGLGIDCSLFDEYEGALGQKCDPPW